MQQRLKYLLMAGVFAAVCGIFAYVIALRLQPENPQTASSSSAQPQPDDGTLEGKLAPDFSLKNLQGQEVKLSDHKGKLVFVNFWATWCEPCKEEMPSMERLYNKMKDRPFEILAISLDSQPTEAVPKFLKQTQLNISFPLLQDAEQKTAKNLFRTTGVPESFIVGADGKVIKHVIGSYEWDSPQIIEYLEALLKEI